MQKLFLDTSVISAFYDFRKPIRQLVTQKWLENDSKNFSLFISDLVLIEIRNTKEEILRNNMEFLIKEMNIELLNINKEIENLANRYRETVIPNEYSDSIHIATASYYRLDAIISWNFNHIVNLYTIKAVHKINIENQFDLIEIISLENIGGNKYGNV